MKAYLYILDTLADWEIGFITSELHTGRYFDKTKDPVYMIKIGNTTKPITTMGGMTITPDESIENITFRNGDLLILPGADTWMDKNNKKILELTQDLLDKNVVVAAICGATVALANTGILNSRKHTSNNLDFLKMICPTYTGESNYLNQPVVTDRNLITATGLAPLEFSYEVIKKTNIMKPETLEAWYQLYKTREIEYFYALMESLK